MSRHVTEHLRTTNERDVFTVLTIYEESVNKEDIKKLNPYTKKREILIFNQYTQTYEYKNA